MHSFYEHILNQKIRTNAQHLHYLLLAFYLILLSKPCSSQSLELTNQFTTRQGLPSNHVYMVVEDKKGFLWIATDNGVARFDGKKFTNFSIRHGLPSNDVIQLAVENNGTLWANCYSKLPSYFDENKNKFITVDMKAHNATFLKTFFFLSKTTNEEIRYQDYYSYFNFKNKELVSMNTSHRGANVLYSKTNEEVFVTILNATNENSTLCIQPTKGVQKIIPIKNSKTYFSNQLYNNQYFILAQSCYLYKLNIKSANPLAYSLDSIKFPEKINTISYSNDKLIAIGESKHLWIYNISNLELLQHIENNHPTNSAVFDHAGRLWQACNNQGLYLHTSQGFKTHLVHTKDDFHACLCFCINPKGEMYIGDDQNQVIIVQKNHKVKKLQSDDNLWVRNIIYANQTLFAMNDYGYSLNLQPIKSIMSPHFKTYYGLKTAIKLNDTSIVIGTLRGLIKFNLSNFSYQFLNVPIERYSLLTRVNDSVFNFVRDNNIYSYSIFSNKINLLYTKEIIEGETIQKMVSDEAQNLWVSTISGNILLLRDRKLQLRIPYQETLPESVTCILHKNNTLWIGGKTGLSQLKFQTDSTFSYSIRKINKNDGLPSNTVNDLATFNNFIYILCDNGVAKIPENYKQTENPIKLELVSISINNSEYPLDTLYHLKSSENNVTLELAGIELTGHFNHLQYAFDNQTWIKSPSNLLNFQLESGKHQLSIRAIDQNNEANSNPLQLYFYVETPFYKSIWFWTLAGILTTSIIFFIVSRRKRERQQFVFEQQLALEKQRIKITEDLHDDIGATLSSLQLNSAVANRLVHKNAKGAEEILDRIENQAHQLSDKLGDIVWSMKNSQDEFMTLSSRITNFTTEIFGATNIDYSLNIDDGINKLVRDISMRKNIVLIIKEALNNCAKYSHAKKVIIQIAIEGRIIKILIADDGKGFDPNQSKGNGIANMKNRVKEHNGNIEFNTSPNEGTHIRISLSLN